MNEANSIAAADASMYMALTGRRPVVEKANPRQAIRGLLKSVQHMWVLPAPRTIVAKLKSVGDFYRDLSAALPE